MTILLEFDKNSKRSWFSFISCFVRLNEWLLVEYEDLKKVYNISHQISVGNLLQIKNKYIKLEKAGVGQTYNNLIFQL